MRLTRSERLRIGAVLLCGFLLTVIAGDWPQFLGPARNGVSMETGLARTWPRQGPPVLWESKVGEGFSGPVVAGDRLILLHRVGEKEVVECLDATNGKERWKFEHPTEYRDDYGKGDGPRSTPLIAGNRVYTLGAEGRLHCLELDTGRKIWSKDLNTEYEIRKSFFGVGTSPMIEGDLLLLNVGGEKAGIVAFDKENGKEVWKATDHQASYSSPVAVSIHGKRHAIFFTREGLVSLDPKSGAVHFSKRWRARINASVNAATPLVVDDHVFISASYNTGALLVRVRPDGMDEIWNRDEVLSNHYNTSVYHAGHLYGVDGRQEAGARLRCIEWKTGKVRWTQERFGCASLVLADGHVIALTEQGDQVLIEATPEAYREKARATVLTTPCRAQIALAHGRLYARDNRKLICLNLKKEAGENQ